jgi:ABC-type nitrate/sulfonate/bicarbonate transport system substrate-binding protein
VIAALLFVPMTLACTGSDSGSSQSDGTTNIAFRQSFTPSEQYLPEVVAIEDGFFEELDLDVTIQTGSGGALSAALVAGGTNPLGIAGASDVLTSIDQGVDITAIAVSIPRDPTALISLRSNPINTVQDISGKRIGIIPGSTSFALLRAALRNNGIDVDTDVTIVILGFGDLVTSLVEGRVDAIAAFETTNVPAIEAVGEEPISLQLSELGVGVPGNVYVVNRDFARENPDAVARFLYGVFQGYQRIQETELNTSMDALIERFPELAEQEDLLSTRWEFELDNGYLPHRRDQAVTFDDFVLDSQDVETLNEALLSTELIISPVDFDSMYDDRYLEMARDLAAES